MADYWISQSGSGIANASSIAACAPFTFFNLSTNWSANAGTPNKISPGDYVHLVGVISGGFIPGGIGTGLIVQQNGQPNNPITILFEPGSRLSAPYWGQGGTTTGGSAINGNVKSYITVDGSGGGVIECTDNGVSGTYQVLFANAILNIGFGPTYTGWLIKNLTIQNMFVPVLSGTGFASSGSTNSYGILMYDGNNTTIQNCTIYNSTYGISLGTSHQSLITGLIVSGCTIYQCPVDLGVAPSVAQNISGVQIRNNLFGVGINWVDANDTHHLAPIHVFGQTGWAAVSGLIVDSNIFTGDSSLHTSALIEIEDEIISPIITNNLCTSINGAPLDGYVDIKRLAQGGIVGTGGSGLVFPPSYALIANNTISGIGNVTLGGRGLYFQSTVNDYFTVQNNILTNLADAIYNTSPVVSGIYSGDYNNFYNNLNIGFWGNQQFNTLTGWQAAITGETHSITGNPNLTNTLNLGTGSAAISAGINLSNIFDNDIVGFSRVVGGPWDIGAYAYTGNPNGDIYIAQNSIGLGNGINAANAAGLSFFNSISNWSSPSVIPGKIGPGTTVHLCGIISGQLTTLNHASGLPGPGSGITIYFEPNCILTSTSGFTAGAISLGANLIYNPQYITIDGGINGIIQCTDNGNLLDYQQNSVGIYISDGNNIVVKNLIFQNIYQRSILFSGNDPNSFGYGVNWVATTNTGNRTPGNIQVTNCLMHDLCVGFGITYGLNWSNVDYSHCTAYNINWGGNAGDGEYYATLSGLNVHHNRFYNFTIWDDTSINNSHHHNGFFAWCVTTGNNGIIATNTMTNVNYYNNFIGPGFSTGLGGVGRASSAIFIQGRVQNVSAINNLFYCNGPSDQAADGMIYFNPYLTASGYYNIFNNTFIGSGVGSAINYTNFEPAALTGSGIQNVSIYNNLGYQFATMINIESGSNSTGAFPTGSLSFAMNNNFAYGLNNSQQYSFSYNGSAHFQNFTQWQASGYDLNGTGTTGLTLLLDQNFKQINNAIQGSGINLHQYFNNDFLGYQRPSVGLWDIGCYLIQPIVPQKNFGILI